MDCQTVQTLLIPLLDGELSPSERELVERHLDSCADCRADLAALASTRQSIIASLGQQAAQAEPSAQAWDRLQARLAQEMGQPKSGVRSRSLTRRLGGKMQTRVLLTSAAAAFLLGAVLMFRGGTAPVSAQDILSRAHVVATEEAVAQGIRHTRSERYYNFQLADQGTRTILDSYLDFQSGNSRQIVTDVPTGKITSVDAYDGTYMYTGYPPEGSSFVTTIYRAPQTQAAVLAQMVGLTIDDSADAQSQYETMRQDPNVELVGQETWDGGRTVYVLRSHQATKIIQNDKVDTPDATITLYVDTQTYEVVGDQATVQQGGKDVIVKENRTLANEILPSTTAVTWNLSDLQGVQIVDDPTGVNVDLLPEPVSQQALAADFNSAYVLKTVPDGFEVLITVSLWHKDDQIYIIAYRDAANNYFVMQGGNLPGDAGGQAGTTYTSASGLTLDILDDSAVDSAGITYTTAIAQPPTGASFTITSNLPLDRVKSLADDLVLAQ